MIEVKPLDSDVGALFGTQVQAAFAAYISGIDGMRAAGHDISNFAILTGGMIAMSRILNTLVEIEMEINNVDAPTARGNLIQALVDALVQEEIRRQKEADEEDQVVLTPVTDKEN